MDLESFRQRVRAVAGPLDLAQLATFERALGAMLPDDYRAFLIVVNGGYVSAWVGELLPPTRGFPLSVLGGLRPEPALSLLTAMAAEPHRGPAPWIWIGGDGANNDLLLALRGPQRGAVLHRDRGQPQQVPCEIAPSFTALIAALWPVRGND